MIKFRRGGLPPQHILGRRLTDDTCILHNPPADPKSKGDNLARTQSKNYAEIRQKILNSAAKLFADQGYSTTTIVDLADACGSSRGALYHYFESKEDILFCIVQEHIRTLLDSLEKISVLETRPVARLRAYARCMLATNAESQHEQIVLLNEVNQLEPDQKVTVLDAQRKITDMVLATLTEVDTSGRISESTGKVYTMMFLGMLNYTYTWFDPKGPVTPGDYADRAVDTFLDGFLAKV